MDTGKEDIKRICGDGLFVKLETNERILEVMGDGCRITMAKNHGSVRIVGDGCRLKVIHNTGDIEYTGDGGQVFLGPKSIKDHVKYTGDGGKVTFDSGLKKTTTKHKKIATDLTHNSISSIDKLSKERMNDVAPPKSHITSTTITEKMDNVLNEKKEAKQQSYQGNNKNEASRKSEKTTKTKIVTVLECDSQLVKKWFVNPGSVIKSFDGASYVKIVPKQSKSKINIVSSN